MIWTGAGQEHRTKHIDWYHRCKRTVACSAARLHSSWMARLFPTSLQEGLRNL